MGVAAVYPLIPQGKKGGSASRRQTEGESDAEQRDAGLDLYTVSKNGGRETKRPPRNYKAYTFHVNSPTD